VGFMPNFDLVSVESLVSVLLLRRRFKPSCNFGLTREAVAVLLSTSGLSLTFGVFSLLSIVGSFLVDLMLN
jgi:hypothetical protein